MSGKRAFWRVVLVLGVALVGAACAPEAETPQPGEGGPGEPADEVEPTETPEEGASVEDPLAGSEWCLIEYGPQGAAAKTLSASQVTIRFENGSLRGAAGCDGYEASYQVKGDALEFGPFDIIDRCEYHVELESIYLGMLETVERFRLTADELVLETAEGALVFARPETAVAVLAKGPVWVLDAIVSGGRGQTVLAGTRLTLRLGDGRATGETGCNDYGADYTLEGESFSVGPAELTQQDCGDQIMAQEALYLSMLGAAQGLRLEDGRLAIATADGELAFTVGKDRPLEGTIWTLGGIARHGAMLSTWVDGGITAKFDSGQITGDAGCNQYFATYEIDGGALHFGPAGHTEMACADEERMARENEFLAALEWVFGYQIKLDELTLLDPEGKPLMILAAAPAASISGGILFDAQGGDPFLRVYAREVNTGQLYWINPGEGDMTYTIPDLPPGTYIVVGWFHPLGASGAYTSQDTVMADGAEQQQACEAAIVEIELQAGEAYAGADIGCWGGDFFGLVE